MTVSRVLNGHPHIRDSTRAQVLKAIEEMSYSPNSNARALRWRRAPLIGVLIGGPVHNSSNGILRALTKAAREAGYLGSAFSIGDDDVSQDPSVLELAIQGIDALCVINPRESLLDLLRRQVPRLPTVVIKPQADQLWRTVGVDQRMGARLAIQHLVGLGHRTIAYLDAHADWYDARERAHGWHESLIEADLAKGPSFLGDWTSDSGFEFGRSFDFKDTTAVFAANDQTALGVIHGLSGRGIRVPEDISVIGFDDLLEARHFLPPLTTVRQEFTELGEVALQQLVAAIEGDTECSHRTIQPQLIVRESTAMARPPDGALRRPRRCVSSATRTLPTPRAARIDNPFRN